MIKQLCVLAEGNYFQVYNHRNFSKVGIELGGLGWIGPRPEQEWERRQVAG